MIKNLIKLLLKLFIIIILIIKCLFVIIWIQHVDPAQQPPHVRSHVFADTLALKPYNLDSLLKIIGPSHGLPDGFEVAAAIAYTAYPELNAVNIDMILTDSGPPMMADVEIWSLLGFRKNRRYTVKINNAGKTFFEPILLRSLPFDPQIGILAHELGHIAYYHKLNTFQFAKWGLCYLRSDEFHAIHERTTDLMPVYHGLGSQIYQYAHFVRRDPSCRDFYQREKYFMDKYYMTDTELLRVLKSY